MKFTKGFLIAAAVIFILSGSAKVARFAGYPQLDIYLSQQADQWSSNYAASQVSATIVISATTVQ